MPKLTVFFKDKEIDSCNFDQGMIKIGRDGNNDLVIDSLAIAPVHALVSLQDGVISIKQLLDEFPITVNGAKTKEGLLNDNDIITLGKHQIMFNSIDSTDHLKQFSESIADMPSQSTILFGGEPGLPTGNLQIMDGENIGRVIPLKKNMIQLGRPGQGIVAITRKKDGYFVSTLENKGTLTLNDIPIANNTFKLNNNDILVINDRSLQFFLH
jgi:hypothetical protein